MSGTSTSRGWLLRLVLVFTAAQGAVSMARPAVSYHALALGADARAVGIVAGIYALLPLAVAVPLGRRTDRGRCAPLLTAGLAMIVAGCALSGTANSLWLLAVWSAVQGLGHLVFVIGAQSLVARQSAAGEHDRNFGHFTIGASLGQLVGPLLAGWLVGGVGGAAGALGGADGGGSGASAAAEHSSAVALFVSGALAVCGYAALWRIENRSVLQRDAKAAGADAGSVPVGRILGTRGVPAGIFTSLAVLSATDVLTAYLPVVGEDRAIPPTVVGVLLSLRAGASVLSRLVLPPMSRLLGRQLLLVVSCLTAGLLCGLLAVPVPVWALALALLVLGFCLGVGQPLTMTTVVRAAPDAARSTALALRLTGNRLGQVAAPAGAGLLAGVAGAAAPFVLLGALLVSASGAVACGADGSGE